MTDELMANLGPLASLAGTWEGDQGVDTAPTPENKSKETKYREKIVFEPFGPVTNHSQSLYVLRYNTIAWPEGSADPFHEELGYWLWDPQGKQVMRSFMVPRAVTLIAGGTAEHDAKSFQTSAEAGSRTLGILSTPFLEKTLKAVRYELKVTIHDDGSFSYEEDTLL